MQFTGRRRIKWSLAVILAIIGLSAAGFQISKARTFQFFGEIVPRIDSRQKAVALTFDDGPMPGATEEVLSVLDEEGVKATFFLIGADLEKNPEQGRMIAARGHELGNHSYSHHRMVLKSLTFIRSEIERTDELIRQTGYRGQIHFRPPYGKKLFLLPYYLSGALRKTVTWDVEPESFADVDGDREKITAHVLANTRPGSIILLHVMYGSRVESLKSVEKIISGLKKDGYEFKTVSELMAIAN
jgi:chitin deacetylase